MRLDRFDLNLLVALDALIEERNVTRAAQRLFVGQSAMSAALARLREYFGDELLVTVGRELLLTPLAAGLAAPVRDTLLRARATLALRPHFDPATAVRQFMFCVSDYVATVLMIDVVRALSDKAPGITVHLQGLPSDPFERFERGDIDFLVLPERYANRVDHPKCHLFSDSFACLAWKENPHLGETLTLENYLSLGHVFVRFGLASSYTFEEWLFPQVRDQRRVEATVDSFNFVPKLLVGTHRLAVVASRLGLQAIEELPLRLMPLPIQMPRLEEVLCWPRHLDQDPAHRWLRQVIFEQSSLLAPAP